VDFAQIGFDKLRTFHSESPFEAVRCGVEQADFRHIHIGIEIDIDCARASGNESVVASSLKSLFDGGGVTRQDLRITSKRRSRIPVSAISKWI
jgi:diketogulonate reductase-like aldo/keto reductase